MVQKKYQTRIIVKIIYTLSVLSGLATFALFFYPTASDAWNRYVASRLISEYIWNVEEVQDYSAVRKMAEKYNQDLFAEGSNQIASYTQKLSGNANDEEKVSGEVINPDSYYESMLNIFDNQMMGYLEIPSIGVSLPVYHYTSEEVLGKGIGHLYGSSLPIGGKNSHTVLTGHSGLLNARIFTDLEKVKEGDLFSVHVLDLVNDYQVDQIKVVLPEELEDLTIHEGKDEVTLVTCTPYGINTHRLLVRGHRIQKEEKEQESVEVIEKFQEAVHFPAAVLGLCVMALVGGLGMIIRIWRKE